MMSLAANCRSGVRDQRLFRVFFFHNNPIITSRYCYEWLSVKVVRGRDFAPGYINK